MNDEEKFYVVSIVAFIVILALALWTIDSDRNYLVGEEKSNMTRAKQTCEMGSAMRQILANYAPENVSADDMVFQCAQNNTYGFGVCFVRPRNMTLETDLDIHVKFGQ